jgi:hypothetical protein
VALSGWIIDNSAASRAAEPQFVEQIWALHIDGDYDRIAEVRPLRVRRLRDR